MTLIEWVRLRAVAMQGHNRAFLILARIRDVAETGLVIR